MPKIEGLKQTTLDVRATDESGKEFIVEMQIKDEKNFTKRSLYYTSQVLVFSPYFFRESFIKEVLLFFNLKRILQRNSTIKY